MKVKCQLCQKESDGDSRTLRLQYLYDLSEISDKFLRGDGTVQLADGRKVGSSFWLLVTCKDCRGDFLELLRRWASGEFVTQAPTDDPDRNIAVRVDGRTVMMNTVEWQAYTANQGDPDRKPYRVVRQ